MTDALRQMIRVASACATASRFGYGLDDGQLRAALDAVFQDRTARERVMCHPTLPVAEVYWSAEALIWHHGRRSTEAMQSSARARLVRAVHRYFTGLLTA